MPARKFGIALLTQAICEVHAELYPLGQLVGESAEHADGLGPLPSVGLRHCPPQNSPCKARMHKTVAPSGSLHGIARCALN